jgi:hypothetical protein
MEQKTVVIEARVDARDLAACAAFLIREGSRPTSRSDLVWRCIKTLAQSIPPELWFETTEEAYGYLISLGLGSMNRNRSNLPTLSKVIARERALETSSTPLEVDGEMKRMIEETAAKIRAGLAIEFDEEAKRSAQKLSIEEGGETSDVS